MNSGLILLNKSAGITSFDALRDIKRILGTGKVGHTGTLDKFAQGLMIVLTGKYLRLSQWFTHLDKKYTGRIHFGAETDTLDPEGNVIAEGEIPSREKIEQVLNKFRGEIIQVPPAFSAIHINGKRASDLARKGIELEMKKRCVTIYSLELISWQPPFADIFVHCSSGTYIRSLARDIAIEAGSRAHLCELTRTQVGGFELDLGEEKREKRKGRVTDIKVFSIDKSIISKLGIPWFEVSELETEYIFQGKPLAQIIQGKTLFSLASWRLGENSLANETTAVFCEETLIAIIEKQGEKWKYACVLKDSA